MVGMTAERTSPTPPRLPVITFWLTGATFVSWPLLILFSLIPGMATVAVGVLAYRRTRTATPPDQARGELALRLGSRSCRVWRPSPSR